VTQQWLHFLEGAAESLDRVDGEVGRRVPLHEDRNNEVLDLWLRIAITHRYSAADARLEEFLMTVGRRKYLEPLYKELVKSDRRQARANAIYVKARPRYHAVTTAVIDEILAVKKG